MKGTQAVFGALKERDAAAFLVNGQLDDLLIDPPDGKIRPGAIYRAKVGRQMKGQGGVVLDTPDGPLFMRSAKGLRQGDTFFVQVLSYAEDGKASPCSSRLLFKSRFSMITPSAAGKNVSKAIRNEERRVELRELLEEFDLPEGIGLVLRTASEAAEDNVVNQDIRDMLHLSQSLLSEPLTGKAEKLLEGPGALDLAIRDWPAPDSTEDRDDALETVGVLDMIDALKSPKESLSSGGHMFVEPTRALVSVDVNTGQDNSPAAGLKANIEALRALPRALRLRGLGGQITIDTAPLAKRDRKQVESVARSSFRADPIETNLVDWTPLGHLELVRKRERLPLKELDL